MGLFKKLKEGFDSAREQMMQNLEEAKQQARQTIEEVKQQAMQNIEETKQQAMQNIKDAQQRILGPQQTTKRRRDDLLGRHRPQHADIDKLDEDEDEPKPTSASEVPTASDGMFSARLEALISSALQDGVLTDQEKAVLKKRAEAEGEDWDEVAMIIDARLTEIRAAKGLATGSATSGAPTKETEGEPFPSQTKETNISSTPETLKETSKDTDGTGLIVYKNGETKVLSADLTEIADEKSPSSHSNIVKIVLPSGIKRIGNWAFYDCDKLEEVDFSRCSKLEVIGEGAFAHCDILKVLDLSGCTELKDIYFQAFAFCMNLESLIISQCKKLEKIGSEAFVVFNGNNSVETISFPVSLKIIASEAFCGFNKLKEVDFSQCMQLESIGREAFQSSQLKQVVFPASLTKIGAAFEWCHNLEVLDFSACTQLESVSRDLVKGLENIKVLDFSNCVNLNLSPLDIPDSFEKIILPPGQKAFNQMFLWDQDRVDSSKCKNVRIIPEHAFDDCEMKEMVIPDSVEIIEESFICCQNLKTIVMPASLKEIKSSLGGNLSQLKKIDFSKVKNLKTLPHYFISDCAKLKELIIPQGVIEIENEALDGIRKLQRVFLPPSLETFGDTGLRNLSIYCFSPSLEELEPIVYGWDDNDQQDDDELDEIDDEELKQELMQERNEKKSGNKNKLFVLPQYLKSYIAQRDAEGIPEDVLPIEEMPEEYRYYYDN